MKLLFICIAIILFALPYGAIYAQNGGMNVGSLNASNSVEVGAEAEHVSIMSSLISLPPMTDSEIMALGSVPKGSVVYSWNSDVLLVFDGVFWKRIDGNNDRYLSLPCSSSFKDKNGNEFKGVQIGEQCWMDRNLEVTVYPNGAPITHVPDASDWIDLNDTNSESDAAYCIYGDPTPSGQGYGLLYTYAAAIRACPNGWHLPSDDEWMTLENFVDTGNGIDWNQMGWRGTDVGTHLKSTTGWISHSGDNSSSFNDLPGGVRIYFNGEFMLAGEGSDLWTATEHDNTYSWTRIIRDDKTNIAKYYYEKSNGQSIRCVKD